MPKENPIRHYRLARSFWDGKQTHARGDVIPLPEDKAPSSATMLTQSEVDNLSAADKAAAAVEVQLPDGVYEDVVAEVTKKVLTALAQTEASKVANADKVAPAAGGSTTAGPKAKN